jgi:D-amino-acid dehydrogenase
MADSPQRSEQHVLVIGGGVIGAACAHYLQQAGRRVTIVDKGRFAGGCSHANCGFICPSHVLPLAEPGALREAFKSLFHRYSPFRVRPRFDLRLWSWFWQFARRCNHHDMVESGHAIQPLLQSSMQLYEELMQTGGIDCEWEKRGLLFVYRTEPAFNCFTGTNDLLTRVFNEPAERLGGEEVREFEPALKTGLAGGWYYEHDAHLRPDKLMQSWRESLERRGVIIREQCEVQGFEQSDAGGERKRATAAITTAGPIQADVFVVATGSWTPFLEKHLGCRVPIQPGKGYSITMPRPKVCPRVPIIFPEHRVAVTPMQSGYRLGSMMEFVGYDETIDPARLNLLTDAALIYLREPVPEPVLETWYGWRPMTWDSRPIIDRSPAWENVYIAAGHNMLGLSMGCATGKLIAELVTGREPHLDLGPYAAKRF